MIDVFDFPTAVWVGLGLYVFAGLFAFGLCRSAAAGDRINHVAQERRATRELYPAGRRGVSNVCWSSPKHGESPVWHGDESDA